MNLDFADVITLLGAFQEDAEIGKSVSFEGQPKKSICWPNLPNTRRIQ
jgi:hypothetical protein